MSLESETNIQIWCIYAFKNLGICVFLQFVILIFLTHIPDSLYLVNSPIGMYLLVSSADNLCKQFGPRFGLIQRPP